MVSTIAAGLPVVSASRGGSRSTPARARERGASETSLYPRLWGGLGGWVVENVDECTGLCLLFSARVGKRLNLGVCIRRALVLSLSPRVNERTTAFASFRSLTPSLPSPVSCTHTHLHSLSLSGFSIYGRRGRVEGISTTFQAWRGLSNSWGARVGAMDWSDNKLSPCALLSLIPRLSLF